MALTPKTKKNIAPPELLDLIPRSNVLPGEDQAQFDDLRQAFLLEFKPSTVYQKSLVEEMADLQWQAARLVRLRDARLIATFRELAAGVFVSGKPGFLFDYEMDTAALQFAKDLVHTDAERRNHALEQLEAFEITPEEIYARAHATIANNVEHFEKLMTQNITNRRKLHEQFSRLKAAQPAEVEDAVLLSNG